METEWTNKLQLLSNERNMSNELLDKPYLTKNVNRHYGSLIPWNVPDLFTILKLYNIIYYMLNTIIVTIIVSLSVQYYNVLFLLPKYSLEIGILVLGECKPFFFNCFSVSYSLDTLFYLFQYNYE